MQTLKPLVHSNAPFEETASPSALVHELIERQCDRTPHAIAVADGCATLRYAELDVRAARVARVLRERGVTAEARVAILADRSVGSIVAMLAVLKAGGA